MEQYLASHRYPNTPAIKVQLLPVNAGERITMTQNLGQPLLRYQAFLCDGMLEVDSTAFMDYMEENDLGYIVDYKRYDADVFTGVNRRTAAVFQFHSAALRRLNKVGCQRYEGDYTRLKQKHAERRARRMAGYRGLLQNSSGLYENSGAVQQRRVRVQHHHSPIYNCSESISIFP